MTVFFEGLGSILLIIGWAWLLVCVPQGLITELAGRPFSRPTQGLAVLALLSIEVLLLLAPVHGWGPRLALAMVASCTAALAYIDFRFLVIPDFYTAALFLIGVVCALSYENLPFALTGALVGGGLVGLLWLGWRWRTGTEGLGFGDVKLATALGVLLGPQLVLWALCIAAFLGLGLSVLPRSRRPPFRPKGEPVKIPLGTTLSLSGGLLLYWSRLS